MKGWIGVLALFIAVMLILPAGIVLAKEKGKPTFGEEKGRAGAPDKWILSNEQISVWFQGKKPMLKVFRTGEDGNRSGYMVKIQEIFEEDESGKKASINLEQAGHEWNISQGDEGEGIYVSLSGRIIQSGAKGGEANITLVFHINTTSAEVKFDLVVEDWEWKSQDPANATLSLKMLVVNDTAMKTAANQATIGHKGYIKWEEDASATYQNGSGALAVQPQIGREGNGTHIILKFSGAGNYTKLSYDPVLGLAGTNWNLIIGITVLSGVGAITVAIYMVSRKRK